MSSPTVEASANSQEPTQSLWWRWMNVGIPDAAESGRRPSLPISRLANYPLTNPTGREKIRARRLPVGRAGTTRRFETFAGDELLEASGGDAFLLTQAKM
jgi:hypothetical protein